LIAIFKIDFLRFIELLGVRMRSALLPISALVIFSQVVAPQTVLSQSSGDVANIAQEITVAIDGDNLGSATIVNRQSTTYTVLTNWHVLRNLNNFSVRTHDGKVHSLIPGSIQRLSEGLDLAIAKFTSATPYRTATLSNTKTPKVGDPVYVTGAPTVLEGLNTRNVLVVPGNVVGIDARPTEGYSLIYNNNTMPGMSGGAVLDERGALVAIHGRGTRDNRSQKAGFNLGIPMTVLSSALVAKIGLSRPVASSQPVVPAYQPRAIAPNDNPVVPSRPRMVDGSEGSNGACAGSRC
jgi:S1-C subfamily serine protease